MTASSDSINLLEPLIELRGTLRFISLFKDMRRETEKQPGEGIMEQYLESPECTGFYPHVVRVCHFPGHIHQPGSSSSRILLGFHCGFLG